MPNTRCFRHTCKQPFTYHSTSSWPNHIQHLQTSLALKWLHPLTGCKMPTTNDTFLTWQSRTWGCSVLRFEWWPGSTCPAVRSPRWTRISCSAEPALLRLPTWSASLSVDHRNRFNAEFQLLCVKDMMQDFNCVFQRYDAVLHFVWNAAFCVHQRCDVVFHFLSKIWCSAPLCMQCCVFCVSRIWCRASLCMQCCVFWCIKDMMQGFTLCISKICNAAFCVHQKYYAKFQSV